MPETMMDEEFLQKLQEAFAIEADEHFRMITKCLGDIEQADPADAQGPIELVFREAHSLKGAARAVNRADIEALCQGMESLLALWKKDSSYIIKEHFAILDQCLSLLEEFLQSDTERSLTSEELQTLVDQLKQHSTAKGDMRSMPSNLKEVLSQSPIPHMSLDEHPHGSEHVKDSAAEGIPTDGVPADKERHEDHASQASSDLQEEATEIPTAAEVTPDRPVSPPVDLPPLEVPRNGNGRARSEKEKPTAQEKDNSPGLKRVTRETVRVSVTELEALYRKTEELSSIKFMIGRTSSDLKLVVDQCRSWLREYQKYRQGVLEGIEIGDVHIGSGEHTAEQYEKLLHFVKWTARQIEGVESAVTKGIEDGRGTMYIMDSMSDSMMDQAKHLLLMPFALLTDSIAPMVRKLARDLQKTVVFHVEGDDVRIDKRILEALKDPLIHMLRNSIDHGIEDPATREREGKSPEGRIDLKISIRDDSRVEVLLRDDGSGIDTHALKKRALREEIIKEEDIDKLDEADVFSLIFHSGLSTSSIITDVSGRGVGMSIVRENVVALGGDVSVNSEKGRGTTFRLTLPVSLSNSRGVLVRSSGRMYIVPLQHVARGMMIHRKDIRSIDGKPVMEYVERKITVKKLEDLLDMPTVKRSDEETDATVLVLQLGGNYIAIEVDEIMWEQDVVIKPLPEPVSRVQTIAGASLLSTGELVPVLNVPDLFDHARSVRLAAPAEKSKAEDTVLSKLLVVDDSITSRVLLHDILISAGYSVKTAVDGIDALTCLREEEYDLVVSDVEMPRMNGFELTEAVRNDEKMHDMPVILVTGLESKEDRERGFDVGANAYIIKSSFDQSNLLDVIERLI